MSKSGPVIGAVAGMLLVVGGVAAAQAFKPVEEKPAPQQSVVQPVVDVPEVTTTTAAPEPAATTAKPKPVKKKAAPVESAPKATTQQRQAVVSDENTEPEPNATLPGRKTRPNPGRPVGPVVIDPQNPAPDPQ